MIRKFLIVFSFLILSAISQDLYAMNRNNKPLTMNKDCKNIEDQCCEATCILVSAIAGGSLGFCVAIASESHLEGADLPSQAAANLFEQSVGCAFMTSLLGEMAYKGWNCLKSKQD